MELDIIKVLPPQRALAFANRVVAREDLWIDRGGFYTIGASTYLDSPSFYPVFAKYTNPVLDHLLHELQYDVMDALPKRFVPNTAKRLHGTAIMGIHIFDPQSNGQLGNPHIDEPFKRIDWGVTYSNPFSFTVALALPEVGGGLEYWPTWTDSEIDMYRKNDPLPRPERLTYEVGMMYVHDGLTPHRIANFGNMGLGEHRITIQGHGVTLADGVTAIYF